MCDVVQGEGTRRRKTMAMDTYNNVHVVTNPWEAAVSPDGKRFYIIYAGTNDINVSEVIDDDYKEIERVGIAIRTGNNPRAVRVSPDGEKVFIDNALDFSVSIYRAINMEKLAEIKVCDPPKTREEVRG